MDTAKKYWEQLSKKIVNPVETKNKRPDTSDLEIDFLKKYLNPEMEILDIGSGSGLIINKLTPFVKHITAVEKYEGFSSFIVESPKILVINADLVGFSIRKQFDVVLSFGVSQLFDLETITDIYHKLYKMTKDGGKLIIRTHCGLEQDKTVNGFSEELQTEYFAQYRQKDKEIELLKTTIGFSDIEVFDIFPDSLNVWRDTRHFIFVCSK